jgi:hypothetical protein
MGEEVCPLDIQPAEVGSLQQAWARIEMGVGKAPIYLVAAVVVDAIERAVRRHDRGMVLRGLGYSRRGSSERQQGNEGSAGR